MVTTSDQASWRARPRTTCCEAPRCPSSLWNTSGNVRHSGRRRPRRTVGGGQPLQPPQEPGAQGGNLCGPAHEEPRVVERVRWGRIENECGRSDGAQGLREDDATGGRQTGSDAGRTSHKRGERNWLLFLAVLRRPRAQGKDRRQEWALSERAVGLRGIGEVKENEEKTTILRAQPREQNGSSGRRIWVTRIQEVLILAVRVSICGPSPCLGQSRRTD